jgi:acyl carrier protein
VTGYSERTMQAAKTRDEIVDWLVTQIADLLELSPEEILVDEPLTYYGLSSADGAILSGDLEDWLGCDLPATVAWEYPTVAKLADYLEAATKNGAGTVEQPHVARGSAAEDGDQPLSYGQRSLWFLHQLAPESSAYHISQAARIRSALDVDALRRAYVRLVERHPALRTTFPSRNGQPVQRIGESPAFDFAFEDARAWSESELARRLEAESARPFRLDEGPLLRVRIFARGAEEHVMLVAIHHIVGDFWSFSVMIREVCTFYEAIVAGEPVSLPSLQSTYCEHARRQGELLAGEQGDRLWSYWQRQLGGMPAHLDLPTDRPRPRIQGFHGASLSARLPAALVEKVRALAAREEVTLFTFLFAAFATLLHRYSAQEEIVVGTPTSGPAAARRAGHRRLLRQSHRAPPRPLGRSSLHRLARAHARHSARSARASRPAVSTSGRAAASPPRRGPFSALPGHVDDAADGAASG